LVDANGTEREMDLHHHRAHLPGPYRLAELANETGATFGPYMPNPYREMGTAYAQGGGYSWTFTLASWTIGVDGGSISVDALDHVRVDRLFAEGDEDPAIQRKASAGFADAGLPEPRMQGLQHGGSIC
jgi:hypothetical protein